MVTVGMGEKEVREVRKIQVLMVGIGEGVWREIDFMLLPQQCPRGVCDVFFFFSSRRRHTRLTCDWSSDVCSSDLDRAVTRQTGCTIQHACRKTALNGGNQVLTTGTPRSSHASGVSDLSNAGVLNQPQARYPHPRCFQFASCAQNKIQPRAERHAVNRLASGIAKRRCLQVRFNRGLGAPCLIVLWTNDNSPTINRA